MLKTIDRTVTSNNRNCLGQSKSGLIHGIGRGVPNVTSKSRRRVLKYGYNAINLDTKLVKISQVPVTFTIGAMLKCLTYIFCYLTSYDNSNFKHIARYLPKYPGSILTKYQLEDSSVWRLLLNFAGISLSPQILQYKRLIGNKTGHLLKFLVLRRKWSNTRGMQLMLRYVCVIILISNEDFDALKVMVDQI